MFDSRGDRAGLVRPLQLASRPGDAADALAGASGEAASVRSAQGDDESPDEDARRMLAFQAGDDVAFDALFSRWADPLLHYVERIVRDRGSAEELVQEVFIRVHGARDRYEARGRFSTWLFTIATNLARNELRRPERKRRLDGERPPEPADRGPAADEVVAARRQTERMMRALDELPPRQREALWLATVEGLAYAEVARVLGASVAAVKVLVHRARVALADRLDESGDRPAPGTAGAAGK